ncbi:MAG: type II CRISPR RNA-guided endonuclease Cas9 [Balneolia bacterium]|nr:type II CRISPR RNA-guided endonuclease Cas9 [Balneolia bacterium]
MAPVKASDLQTWSISNVLENDAFKNWIRLNPYELRDNAVQTKVSPHDLGRIFYHMIQRRGFQSNSRTVKEDEGAIFDGKPADGKIGIMETRAQIRDDTLGAYLNTVRPEENEPYTYSEERVRNRYTTRKMYIDEFEAIWEVQSVYHDFLDDKLKTAIGGRKKDGYSDDGVLFFQRPLKSQKHLIGKCTFEPNKPKCPKSAIPFELFRIYQWVNTVECNNERLSSEDRHMLVEKLLSKEKLTFKQLRKVINKAESHYQFNYKDDDKILGSHTIAFLSAKNMFGNSWSSFSDEQQDEIWHDLYFYEDKELLREKAIRKWKLSDKAADEFVEFRLREGYSQLSRKAIGRILPFLKAGFQYDVAVTLGGIRNAFGDAWEDLEEEQRQLISDNIFDIIRTKTEGGYINTLKDFLGREFGLNEKQLSRLYHHSTSIEKTHILEKLPVGREADIEIQKIRNPIVITALFELRKVVNELIDHYGKPDQINIELARDLKVSKDKRNDIRREQQRLERENDRVKSELDKIGQVISHENILKYKLWEECNQTCPFTGEQIGINDLFTGRVQIEHIHPWSRSLNDSFMNKTLCYADENRAKGNRLPYEFYCLEQSEEKWDKVKSQALTCFTNKKNYPNAYMKFKNFVKKEIDSDFTSKHLNDTRYISREAKSYLSRICGSIRVSPGQLTSNLRSKWGLNSILVTDGDVKTRDDHRHHAIDALVMACMKTAYLQELSRWNRYNRSYDVKDFPLPWEGFREQAIDSINAILVSHQKRNRAVTKRRVRTRKNGRTFINDSMAVRGQLHKESVYGKRTSPEGVAAYHIRKPLESITTEKQVQKIVDPAIRRIIEQRIEECGGYKSGKVPDGAFFRTDEAGYKYPEVFLPNKNGDNVPVRKVRMRENLNKAEQLRETNQHVNPRNNHHVLIYEDENGEMQEQAVTLWTAAERRKQGDPVIQLPYNGTKVVASLEINDMFIVGYPEELVSGSRIDPQVISGYIYRVQKVSDGDYSFRIHTASTIVNKAEEIRISSFKKWQTERPVKVEISPSGFLRLVP